MKRSTARELAIQLMFAAASSKISAADLMKEFFSEEHYATLKNEHELFEEFPDKRSMEYIRRLVSLTEENRSEIDSYIEYYSKGWKLERISRTALAVMRCAICEILFMEDIPNSAAINEAVELCKGYDEPDVVSFVNGVLGGFMRGKFSGAAQEDSVCTEEPSGESCKAESKE